MMRTLLQRTPLKYRPRSRDRGSVLAVEDDPLVRELAVDMLRLMGYEVFTAVDAPDALAQLQAGVPADVLFTDVMMPNGQNGIDLAHRARQLRPRLQVLLASEIGRAH